MYVCESATGAVGTVCVSSKSGLGWDGLRQRVVDNHSGLPLVLPHKCGVCEGIVSVCE